MRPVPFLVTLASTLLTAMLLGSPARAESPVAGTWTGTYRCGGASASTMSLELEDSGGRLSGTFSFNAEGQDGAYAVAGRLRPDGRFSLVPREWIERPRGFTALTIEGAVNGSGRAIEGRMSPCMVSGDFSAERAVAAGETAHVEQPPQPLDVGPLAGAWTGGVSCRQNRRGNTETYPFALDLFSDGNGVGGIGRLKVYKKRNSGAGDAFEQILLLSGIVDGDSVRLHRSLVIDFDGAPGQTRLRGLDGTVAGGSAIEGQVRMNGCETVALRKDGETRATPIPEAMSGQWAGAIGRDKDTIVVLTAVTDSVPGFFELRAAYPASLPDARRDRLKLVLMPVAAQDGGLLLVPVSRREATGIFDGGDGPRRHFLSQWAGALVSVGPEGDVSLLGLSNERDLQAGAGSRNAFQLSRPSAEQEEALAAGETPPVDLGGLIEGQITAAPTREAQCRVLAEWLEPYAEDADLKRMSVDAVFGKLAPAFDDPFEPVFGLPFLETTQEERTAVARFIRGACRQAGMDLVRFAGDFILATDNQFAKFNTIKADRQDTALWLDGLSANLDELPAEKGSLTRIQEWKREIATRSRDMEPAQRKRAEAELADRQQGIVLAMYLAEIDAIPADSFEQGGLSRTLAVLNRGWNADLDDQRKRELVAGAKAKATAILDRPLREAAGLAPDLPVSLEGLERGQAAMQPFQGHRQAMDRWFGSIDPGGILRPLHARLDEIRADAGVKADFRDRLMQAADGPDGPAQVRAVAARYFDPEGIGRHGDYAEILADVELVAEVRAVRIVDETVNRQPGEPDAETIASFALQRVRELNSALSAQEDMCMSSGFTNAIEALSCLSVPGIVTGQKGFGARLIAVRKLGCVTEVADTQYLCTFTQEIQIDMPGADAFGGATLTDMARRMSSGEAVDARFIKATGGRWTVIWGDLK